jgi:hypothetical protein
VPVKVSEFNISISEPTVPFDCNALPAEITIIGISSEKEKLLKNIKYKIILIAHFFITKTFLY